MYNWVTLLYSRKQHFKPMNYNLKKKSAGYICWPTLKVHIKSHNFSNILPSIASIQGLSLALPITTWFLYFFPLIYPQNSKNSTTKILKCHPWAQPTPAASHATQNKEQSPSHILQNHTWSYIPSLLLSSNQLYFSLLFQYLRHLGAAAALLSETSPPTASQSIYTLLWPPSGL